MRKTQPILFFVLTVLLTGSALADQCHECHNTSVFKVKNKAHYDYHVGFETSVHGLAGLGCADCHGGDSETDDKDAAHAGVRENVMRENIPRVCGSCHEGQHEAFLSSGHFQALEGERNAPHCATCHGSMEMDVLFVSKVTRKCRKCHEPSGEDAVVVRTEELMNRVNTIVGYLRLIQAEGEDPAEAARLQDGFDRLVLAWHRLDYEAADERSDVLLRELRRVRAEKKIGQD